MGKPNVRVDILGIEKLWTKIEDWELKEGAPPIRPPDAASGELGLYISSFFFFFFLLCC